MINLKMISQIDINIAEDVSADAGLFSQLVEKAIDQSIKTAKPDFPPNAELSILIANDKKLQELNAQWRGKDKPTNVLSFPSNDLEIGEMAEVSLGDIAISLETTSREAALENKTLNDHFSHLIVHGFLHLFGYDHETDKEAEMMESLETRILAELGIENPY